MRTALLCELIQEMHSIYGGTYIVVTHDIASARGSASTSRCCGAGGSSKRATPQRMFSSENPFVRQFLAGAAEGPLTMD